MLRPFALGLFVLLASTSLTACGGLTRGGAADAGARPSEAGSRSSPVSGDSGNLDSGHDATNSGLPPTPADGVDGGAEVAADAATISDAVTCEPPQDATYTPPNGSLCTYGNCERGGIPCCPGFGCAACWFATSDGSFAFDLEAGPFFCNVEKR